jgi:hypothetical protein
MTLTKKLPSATEEEGAEWEIIMSVDLEMSWGSSKIFVH